MAADTDPVKLQDESTGILIDKYKGSYIDCVTSEGVVSKAETYVYRCSKDKICCATGCCLPGAAGFPLWLLILILVLAFLLALLLLGFLIYYCCIRRKNGKGTKIAGYDERGSKDALPVVVTGTPPRVEIFDNKRSPNGLTTDVHNDQPPPNTADSNGRRKKRSTNHRQKAGQLRHDDHHTSAPNTQRNNVEHVTVLTDLDSDVEAGTANHSATAVAPTTDQSRAQLFSGSTRSFRDQSHLDDQTYRGDQSRALADQSSFEPSHMEVSYERPPKPIPVSYHDRSEISVEKRPLMNRLERPEEARMVYYKAESSRNESFKEHAEYDDD